ncbi:hypothetical protein K466DRAFT_506089 [Polyporus arcularius HHB13444]|uniref:Peptidase C19 ubiquitin carboxyl-terminal hydrolase domain-containing protein n=1 Tax=Polyporus arcularius HHB13444 TaxID=1314778 RepID=A0A5C3NPE0_9APHY|nr:hypothetical protein K466DRAFT_506089 [Polyporus arcularius HHB13444]
MYCLCGIVYHKPSHFVSRIIDKSGGIWYHDGIANGGKVVYYNNIVNYNHKKLQTTCDYVMAMLLYTKL